MRAPALRRNIRALDGVRTAPNAINEKYQLLG